jgi:phosphoribosyl 1,2-cyclic phosphate phosphodiesterase
MKLIFLGTGTSTGIPMLGCNCPVCTSTNPKNNRTRPSLLVTYEDKNILIDASTDLRQQALRHKLMNIDAVLCTHVHADHVFGLDDLRPYNEKHKKELPFYATKRDCEELKDIFHHVFEPPLQIGGGLPRIKLIEIDPKRPFELFGLRILPIEIYHGILPILGYRIGGMAYLTDCSRIPEESFENLKELDVLILDALRVKEHPTHFNIEQAVAAAQRIAARRTFFTHIAHDLDHGTTNKMLPKGMELAYDGLEVSLT